MTTNRYSTRYYSKKQEDKMSKELGLKATPNSGATAFSKGDVTDSNILMECKTLMKNQKSVTLQKEWFDKNLVEAQSMGRQFSVLAFNFGPNSENYVAMDKDDFNNMYTAWKAVND